MSPLDAAALVRTLYERDEDRFFDDPAGVPMVDPPIVAVADAADPWFARLRALLGAFYWTPDDALRTAFGDVTARSVICWSLPVSAVAREANGRERELPARPWAYVRTFGAAVNRRLRHDVTAALLARGAAAVAPADCPAHTVADRPATGLPANWSERHTAFVAGLGTFGLSGGLITARGIAHRLGSVVTDLPLPATERPYGDDPFALCLRTARGTCGACIDRCPAGSIGERPDQRDKTACRDWAYRVVAQRGRSRFDWDGTYGCGLCQTAVPCESCNPMA